MITEKSIFLVDDHQMFLDGIFSVLKESKDYTVVGTAQNAIQALKILPNFNVDIIITDIEMPEMDGLDFAKKIKEASPHIKVLIASSHLSITKINMAIENKVNGYLIKNAGKTELMKALNKISAGEDYFSKEVTELLRDYQATKVESSTNKIKLSPREKEVLRLIADEKSTQEITEILFISSNTVETHRKNLMRKIGAKNMIGLVKYAMKHGVI